MTFTAVTRYRRDVVYSWSTCDLPTIPANTGLLYKSMMDEDFTLIELEIRKKTYVDFCINKGYLKMIILLCLFADELITAPHAMTDSSAVTEINTTH